MKNWKGFALSLFTAVMWGVLPIFLQISLQAMDSATITWYRFLFAGVVVGGVLYSSNRLPKLRHQGLTVLLLVLVASLALVANYVGNVEALDYINPETVQVVMQIAPLMLMLGGVVFYKEHLSRLEVVGALVLIAGLILFFNQRLDTLFGQVNALNTGVGLTILAAVFWAIYALFQKRLLRSFSAKQLTLCIYIIGVIVLLPLSTPGEVVALNTLQAGALLFCCFNTMLAYGAFTEAMHVWSASKVSAVIATSPVFAFISVWVAQQVWPQYFALSQLDWLAVIGALMVIGGSMTTALAKPRTNLLPKAQQQ